MGLKLTKVERQDMGQLQWKEAGKIPYDGGGQWAFAIEINTGMPVLRHVHSANLGDEPGSDYYRVEKA